MIRSLCVLILLATVLAVDNPSGTCTASTDGSRIGYSPGAGDQYLPDCNGVLKREYWRVFVKTDGKAYVVPRPDGMGVKYDLCGGNGELAGLLDQYAMCTESIDSQEKVDKINSMEPADALRITNELHKNLLFKAHDSGNDNWGFDPYAVDDDIIDACKLLDGSSQSRTVDSDAAKSYCNDVKGRCTDGVCIEIAYPPSEGAAKLLAPYLNELYQEIFVSAAVVWLPASWTLLPRIATGFMISFFWMIA